ncbi:hypothetical protein LSTR_LSTR000354 [Laodelphax striatellus]|uniref:Uncharacterized protein n=1 Tax=Laodelphax striatellus TaxID=195883 RepID=A0A482X3J0_LAOST|nr:hypothetical protein LSTR_LSTR000354 [Laodelphax striatellus]
MLLFRQDQSVRDSRAVQSFDERSYVNFARKYCEVRYREVISQKGNKITRIKSGKRGDGEQSNHGESLSAGKNGCTSFLGG